MLRRLTLSLLYSFLVLAAASADSAPAIFDAATRIGVLDNGIRYYILKNAKPEDRVEMRLVVRAGSLQERPEEAGIAHLIEHMAFEGTEHFGPQEIVSFLESNGMRFGNELNASTTMTSTQYFLDLPTGDPAVLEKGLGVLRDWTRGPKVTAEYLEKEKKIIIEEERYSRKSAQSRMNMFLYESYYEGSAYAGHDPMGTPESVSAITAEGIARFVRSWYKPKAMSLVIVGSVDLDAMEALVRVAFADRFGDDSEPEALPPRPRTSANQYRFFKDPELASDVIVLSRTESIPPAGIEETERLRLIGSVALNALNKRLGDIARKPDSAFMVGIVAFNQFGAVNINSDYIAVPRDGRIEDALAAYMTEMRRAASFGLTESEYRLGLKAFVEGNGASNSQKDNITNAQKAKWVADWIVNGIYFGYSDALYAYRARIAAKLTREEVNAELARRLLPDPAKLILVTIDKAGRSVPDAEALAAIKAKALSAEVAAVAERVMKPLMPKSPARGAVVKSEKIAGTPYELWTLSNGIKVYLYNNSLTKNDFLLRAFAPGGRSTLSDEDCLQATYATGLVGQNGVGDLSFSELKDFLTGKKANIRLSVEECRASIYGTTDPNDPEDMEKFFQWLHVRLKGTRRDADAEGAAFRDLSESVANNEKLPMTLLNNELTRLVTGSNERMAPLTSELVKSLDAGKAAALLDSFYSAGSPFTFVITGSYDEYGLKRLVETYIASLPVDPSAASASKDLGWRFASGPIENVVRAGQDEKSVVALVMDRPYPFSASAWHLSTVLKELLTIRLREALRQDKGGTYGVNVSLDLGTDPYPHARIVASFTCDPARREELVATLKAELASVAAGKFGDEDFEKALKIRQRALETAEKTNASWMDNLYWSLAHGDDPAAGMKWPAFYAAVAKKDIAKIAKALVVPDKAIVVILEPEK